MVTYAARVIPATTRGALVSIDYLGQTRIPHNFVTLTCDSVLDLDIHMKEASPAPFPRKERPLHDVKVNYRLNYHFSGFI